MCAMERLQKILARAGIASRRKCEEYIVAGRVTVDGVRVTTLGTKADADTQVVALDTQPIFLPKRLCIALYKPKGYICTDDPEMAPRRACDLVKGRFGRLFTVGRLDKASEGLVLLVNDGELANRLAHPRYGVPKTYRVIVKGQLQPDEIERLAGGVWLAEGKTHPCRVRKVHADRQMTCLDVTIDQGLNRQIRRMFARLGRRVRSLKRIGEGPVKLDRLKPGGFRILGRKELDALDSYVAARQARPENKRGRRA